tara:strand:+ start:1095 stop:1766 length:672 start_codon:yes stop_codon:yes gene_type:complete
MKKAIIFSVFIFILTATSSFGQIFGGPTDAEFRDLSRKVNKNIQDISSAEREIRSNGSSINQARSDISLRRTEIRNNTNEIDSIKEDVTNLNNEVATKVGVTSQLSKKILQNEQDAENNQNRIAAIEAQLQNLVAQLAEKDRRIAELESEGGGQSLEDLERRVRDARPGSVVLTVDPDGENITLGLIIEQSDNLIEWKKLEGEITRTIAIPEGKRFYRFAFDK